MFVGAQRPDSREVLLSADYAADHFRPRKEGCAEALWKTAREATVRSAGASHGFARRLVRFPGCGRSAAGAPAILRSARDNQGAGTQTQQFGQTGLANT